MSFTRAVCLSLSHKTIRECWGLYSAPSLPRKTLYLQPLKMLVNPLSLDRFFFDEFSATCWHLRIAAAFLMPPFEMVL